MKATHIAVVQSGWVFVGTKNEKDADPSIFRMDNAACVRQWGTTKGLGEIALAGPTDRTILDPCGTVECNKVNVLFTIPVDQARWQ